MDNTSVGLPAQTGEMSLEQIPKELRPNKYEHKSPWALLIILVVAILFGVFYFVEIKDQATSSMPVINQQALVNPKPTAEQSNLTNDLEASVGSIDIPSYSDEL